MQLRRDSIPTTTAVSIPKFICRLNFKKVKREGIAQAVFSQGFAWIVFNRLAFHLKRELQREQQRIKDMELHGEQQKKVMKVKLEEMSSIQRKLRVGMHSSYSR